MDATTARYPLLPPAIAFAAGVAWDLEFGTPTRLLLAVATIAAAGWCRWHHRGGVGTVFLLLGVAVLGALRHHASRFHAPEDDLARLIAPHRQLIQLDGVVVSSPRQQPPPPDAPVYERPATRWQLRSESIRRHDCFVNVSGNLQVVVRGSVNRLIVGDRVRLTGWLRTPAGRRNPGGFNYGAFLTRRGIQAILSVNDPRSISHRGVSKQPGDRIRRWQAKTRAAGVELLSHHLSVQTVPVAAALLLGVREDLEPDQRDVFVHSGTMHLLAISGLHVGLLAGLVWSVCRLLHLRTSITTAVVIVGVIAFATIVETRPSVLRATILVVAGMLGRPWNRQASGVNSLALAGLVVLGLRPGDLQSPGAQLSFLAVGGLMYSAPRIAKLLPLTAGGGLLGRGWRRLVQAWLVGCVIWSVTAPMVAAHFGLFAPVGLVINVLLIPLVAIALWLGFGLLICGGWLPLVGIVLGTACDRLLALLLLIARTAADGPLSHIATPPPSTGWLLLFHGLLIVLVTCRHRGHYSLCLVAILAVVAGGLVNGLQRSRNTGLQVTILDVGHGGAILVECPGGNTLLYDAGTLRDGRQVARLIRDALWSRRRRRLDVVVLSHADRDHYNAAAHLVDLVPIGTLATAHSFFDHQQPETFEIGRRAVSAGIALKLVAAGDTLKLAPGVRITVRHPAHGFQGSSDNSNSLVLEIVFRDRRLLLTGDVERDGLDDLLAAPIAPIDVLMSPHHGSPTANPARLARWARPKCLVISGSRSSNQPLLRSHFGPTVRILSTHDRGAISISIDGDGAIRIRTATGDPSLSAGDRGVSLRRTRCDSSAVRGLPTPASLCEGAF